MDTNGFESLLNGAQNSQSQVQQINDTLTSLKPLLEQVTIASIILSVVITVVFIINAVYKLRVERAILRIDKNVQLLLAAQTPPIVTAKPIAEPTPDPESES